MTPRIDMPVRISGGRLVDRHGRTLLIRGINVSGSSKVPTRPDGRTHLPGARREPEHASFVSRPFPLESAAEHFERIAGWGFSSVRLLVTWEAIEHEAPGVYDRAFLDYLRNIVDRAADSNLWIVIDAHQDAWGRLSGGDGAPAWTYDLAGFDPSTFDATGAAINHDAALGRYPRMIWPTNRAKLAAATMYTLFFAGSDFAPNLRAGGEPIQEVLQRHRNRAYVELVTALRGAPNIIGYDLMNEPYPGYIGMDDICALPEAPRIGPTPTAIQGMALGDGASLDVEVWSLGMSGARRRGTVRLNAGGQRCWRPGTSCPWKRNGVWTVDAKGNAVALRRDYFSRTARGERVRFDEDYLVPYYCSFSRSIHEASPDALLFIEGLPGGPPPEMHHDLPARAVAAPHWYDGVVLMLGRYISWIGGDYASQRVVLGRRNVARSYAEQLRKLLLVSSAKLAGAPAVFGESGIPFDIAGRSRFGRPAVVRAMDRVLRAMEAALASYFLWNYTAENEEAWGDGWNGENMSVYGPGLRAAAAFVRPYPRAVAGALTSLRFELRGRRFSMTFDSDDDITAVTEIFVPSLHYPNGFRVAVSDGVYAYDRASQTVAYRHDRGRASHTIVISPMAARPRGRRPR